MSEIWKEVPDFPGYEVSNQGRVRSLKRTMIRVLSPSAGPYRGVGLMRNGKGHRHRIGRLVLLAFVGLPPNGMEMCHNDGNPTNDRLANLRWDTHSGNMQDMLAHGTRRKSGPNPKLDQEEVRTIRIKFASGKHSRQELAKEFGISISTINYVLAGQGAYRGGLGPIQRPRPYTQLTDQQVEAIRKERTSGKGLASLAEKYGISISSISRITLGNRRGKAAGPRTQPYKIICRPREEDHHA